MDWTDVQAGDARPGAGRRGVTGTTGRILWGWTGPIRGLLAAGSLAVAIGLGLASGRAEGPGPGLPVLIVDPNTAPPGVLLALPRLGPALVGRIVEARRRAPFRSAADLDARVRGIGPATIAGLRPHLSFGPAGAGGR